MKNEPINLIFDILKILERLSRGAGMAGATKPPPAPPSTAPSQALYDAPSYQLLVDRNELARMRNEFRNQLMALRTQLEQQLSERECYQALFPLVVCCDELVQTRYANVDQTVWPLLQREFFEIDQGGELFYTTIDEMSSARPYPSLVYELYLFCLRIGFKGKYSGNEEKIAAYLQQLGKMIGEKPFPRPQHEPPAPGTIAPIRSHWWYYSAAMTLLLLFYLLFHALADDTPGPIIASTPRAPNRLKSVAKRTVTQRSGHLRSEQQSTSSANVSSAATKGAAAARKCALQQAFQPVRCSNPNGASSPAATAPARWGSTTFILPERYPDRSRLLAAQGTPFLGVPLKREADEWEY